MNGFHKKYLTKLSFAAKCATSALAIMLSMGTVQEGWGSASTAILPCPSERPSQDVTPLFVNPGYVWKEAYHVLITPQIKEYQSEIEKIPNEIDQKKQELEKEKKEKEKLEKAKEKKQKSFDFLNEVLKRNLKEDGSSSFPDLLDLKKEYDKCCDDISKAEKDLTENQSKKTEIENKLKPIEKGIPKDILEYIKKKNAELNDYDALSGAVREELLGLCNFGDTVTLGKKKNQEVSDLTAAQINTLVTQKKKNNEEAKKLSLFYVSIEKNKEKITAFMKLTSDLRSIDIDKAEKGLEEANSLEKKAKIAIESRISTLGQSLKDIESKLAPISNNVQKLEEEIKQLENKKGQAEQNITGIERQINEVRGWSLSKYVGALSFINGLKIGELEDKRLLGAIVKNYEAIPGCSEFLLTALPIFLQPKEDLGPLYGNIMYFQNLKGSFTLFLSSGFAKEYKQATDRMSRFNAINSTLEEENKLTTFDVLWRYTFPTTDEDSNKEDVQKFLLGLKKKIGKSSDALMELYNGLKRYAQDFSFSIPFVYGEKSGNCCAAAKKEESELDDWFEKNRAYAGDILKTLLFGDMDPACLYGDKVKEDQRINNILNYLKHILHTEAMLNFINKVRIDTITKKSSSLKGKFSEAYLNSCCPRENALALSWLICCDSCQTLPIVIGNFPNRIFLMCFHADNRSRCRIKGIYGIEVVQRGE